MSDLAKAMTRVAACEQRIFDQDQTILAQMVEIRNLTQRNQDIEATLLSVNGFWYAANRKVEKLEAALRRIAAYSQGLTPIPGDPIEIARTALGSEMETSAESKCHWDDDPDEGFKHFWRTACGNHGSRSAYGVIPKHCGHCDRPIDNPQTDSKS